MSIENDRHAHATLTLRSFYRQFSTDAVPAAYMDFLAGHLGAHPEDGLFRLAEYEQQAAAARSEARLLTLGKDTRAINNAIANVLGKRSAPWVLIGGPPCQAYSLVGRARNRACPSWAARSQRRLGMYYEEKQIGWLIYCRSTPDGEWRLKPIDPPGRTPDRTFERLRREASQ